MSRQQKRSSLSTPSGKRNGKTVPSPAVPLQTPASRPANDDRDAWKAYWIAQSQPWRTEPEIDSKRQEELAQRRAIVPDVEKGIYPFKGMKLSRADVEWLLVTLENGRGPIDWSDQSQRRRNGIDVRGADLRQVDLSRLPLARLRGSLGYYERLQATKKQCDEAAVLMESVNLRNSQLGRAYLNDAHLENANLRRTYLEDVGFRGAHLEGAKFGFASLAKAHLREADLKGADFRDAYLEGARLENVVLTDERHVGPLVVDAYWGNVNLAVVKWSQVTMLGDECVARQRKNNGKVKDRAMRRDDYETAVRANRQLAVVLQSQGINEEAARFIYRAQVLQRKTVWTQRLFGKWLFSWFLSLIAGYGYRPSRSFLAYFLVITGFAMAYYFLGHTVGPVLSPLGAFVFSMTSFHGRGFFPGNNISLDNSLTVLAALEALVGLIIEVTFIATLTQRFFNR